MTAGTVAKAPWRPLTGLLSPGRGTAYGRCLRRLLSVSVKPATAGICSVGASLIEPTIRVVEWSSAVALNRTHRPPSGSELLPLGLRVNKIVHLRFHRAIE